MKKLLPLAALIIVVIVIQKMTGWTDTRFYLTQLTMAAYYALLIVGLCVVMGYAGQISLGHAGFFAIGAYGSAIGTSTLGGPAWPVMIVVALVAALIALAVGLPALKLSGHYLAMATLGFNIVVYTILVQWDAVTGGPSGFSGIPYLRIGPVDFDNEISFHYLVWTFAVLALLLCLNLVRSGVGRGLAALAEDETAAAALGVDTRRAKVKVFILSAVLAALAGSLFLVGMHLRVLLGGGQLIHQRMLGRQDHEGRAPQRIRAGGENFHRFARFGLKDDVRALAAPDPVGLHGDHPIRPVDL